jgi:hypothetical protein
MTESYLADRILPKQSCGALLTSSWPPTALGHGYHGAFGAGTCRGKTGGRCSRVVRRRSRCAVPREAGAIGLLGGRQWAVVASSVLLVMELLALRGTSRSSPKEELLAPMMTKQHM